jgi:hypothetical protein
LKKAFFFYSSAGVSAAGFTSGFTSGLTSGWTAASVVVLAGLAADLSSWSSLISSSFYKILQIKISSTAK